MNFFAQIFNSLSSLSTKLPSTSVGAYFMVVLLALILAGTVVGFTYMGNSAGKMKHSAKKALNYLKSKAEINEDNVGDFTYTCFGNSSPRALREAWVKYLGVRFGYPSDIVSEKDVFDREVKKDSVAYASVFIGVALILVAFFAFWGMSLQDKTAVGAIVFAGLLVSGIIYLVLVWLSKKQYSSAREMFYELQDELDAKVDLQVENDFSTDASPIYEITALIDDIIARNTAKVVDFPAEQKAPVVIPSREESAEDTAVAKEDIGTDLPLINNDAEKQLKNEEILTQNLEQPAQNAEVQKQNIEQSQISKTETQTEEPPKQIVDEENKEPIAEILFLSEQEPITELTLTSEQEPITEPMLFSEQEPITVTTLLSEQDAVTEPAVICEKKPLEDTVFQETVEFDETTAATSEQILDGSIQEKIKEAALDNDTEWEPIVNIDKSDETVLTQIDVQTALKNTATEAEIPKEEAETPKEETSKALAPKEETPKEETPKEETPKEETSKDAPNSLEETLENINISEDNSQLPAAQAEEVATDNSTLNLLEEEKDSGGNAEIKSVSVKPIRKTKTANAKKDEGLGDWLASQKEISMAPSVEPFKEKI